MVVVVNQTPGPTITLEELREFGASRLTGYKLPRELIVRPLPRNPSGPPGCGGSPVKTAEPSQFTVQANAPASGPSRQALRHHSGARAFAGPHQRRTAPRYRRVAKGHPLQPQTGRRPGSYGAGSRGNALMYRRSGVYAGVLTARTAQSMISSSRLLCAPRQYTWPQLSQRENAR